MNMELIPKNITAIQLFSENGLDPVLDKIKAEIDLFYPDIETDKGRKGIASFSRKIASSKVFIEKAGKELVSGMKAKTKLIDAERKRSRDTLDQWRDEVRQPLTEWENAEKIRVEKERQFEIYLLEWDDAIQEDTLVNREREMERKEAVLAKIEDERLKKEEAERLEKERVENEARIKAEAEAKAKRDAEEKITAEREAKERAIWEAKEALAREENIRLKAEDDAKHAAELAEHNRIEAEKQAKADQEAAVKKAQEDAEAKAKKEREEENYRITAEKEEEERKASNKRHQASVNNKVLSGLVEFGIDEDQAKKLVIHLAKGGIPKLSILY